MCACTLASASAIFSSSASVIDGGTLTTPRSLPFTCTGISSSSAFATSASNAGHARRAQAVGVAVHLPQLFHRVRRKRRQHHDQRLDRLARHLAGLRRALALLGERVELVDQLHHRRHGGIHLLAHVDVDASRA